MNDNYLWDRTGEIDPEIQQLEETLGALRYQPHPLQIPAHLQIGRRRRFYPALAIAAAIALVAIALGLWVALKQHQTAPSFVANQESPRPKQIQKQPVQPNDQPEQAGDNKDSNPKINQKGQREPVRNLLAVYKTRGTRTAIRQPQLTPQELAEKEQVLVALRLVSAKLNIAQRRTQGSPALNSIRNQHKIG